MRILAATALLALAALATAPSAAATGGPVCVPPNAGNGACVGSVDGDPCVWTWLGPTFRGACLDDEARQLIVCNDTGGINERCRRITIAVDEIPQTACTPDVGVGACLFLSAPHGVCVLAYFGLQGAVVCVDPAGPTVRICSSLYTTLYGYCPTDLLA